MAEAPVRRTRWPRGLSRRVAWLTMAVVLLGEAMAFLPALARDRAAWLDARLDEAQIAALVTEAAPDGVVDRATVTTLLRLSGAAAIRLDSQRHSVAVLPPDGAGPGDAGIDLRHETHIQALARTLCALLSSDDSLMTVEAHSVFQPDAVVTAVLHRRELHTALLRTARQDGVAALLEAMIAGAVLYALMLALLVRPMRRLTESIAAFRADPERASVADTAPPPPGDEIGAAAIELAAMQAELRTALWRNARLAALGAALAKVSHDLRGILSPALLTAERLQMNADPAVKRAGDVLVRTVERATDLVQRTVEFARETPVTLSKAPLTLRHVAEDAAEQARAACPTLAVENAVPDDIDIEADRESIVRVLANLLRNAGEAGARRARVAAESGPTELTVMVTDDGPGLPAAVQANLFKPFAGGGRRGGAGLGLAIVRDLMRAHGGDVALLSTGASGTRFALTLPLRRPVAAPGQMRATG